ncbi:MAG: alginate export family protein [Sphingomonas sp.]
MKHLLAAMAGLLTCGAAQAQDVTFKPIADARLRYELVDQDGLPNQAGALTLRLRPGVIASAGKWSALVEGETNIMLAGPYNDGLNGKTAYPLVADPPNAEINRAQIRYAGKNGLALTAGRQRLELADMRFVGNAPWRQSEQTFDAVRAQWGGAKGLSADLTYSWSDRTVNGRHGIGARPTAIGGDNVFALLNYGTGIGTLTGFAYLVDQDRAAVQGFRLSSQTYGVRFAGSRPVAKGVKIAYAASWARQSDYHRNPNNYSADYWLGEAVLTAKAVTATAGYEVLGADKGVALTSVQTPLASYFKFNGWAGKFGTTPPNGLHDLYGTLGYGWKKVRGIDAIGVSATYHRFDSDRLNQHYGDEVDLLASIKKGHTTLSARYAHYTADAFATDTDKFWLSIDWAL